jgi:hypothetical protein
LPENTPLILTAVLTGESEAVDVSEEVVDSVFFVPADLWGHPVDNIQFVELLPVDEMRDGPQLGLFFQGRVAYHLSNAYEDGSFSISSRYQNPSGNGGGGGGGGGQPLSPGVGLIWLRFVGSGGADLTVDNWTEQLTIEATLRGVTVAGKQVVVDTAVYVSE